MVSDEQIIRYGWPLFANDVFHGDVQWLGGGASLMEIWLGKLNRNREALPLEGSKNNNREIHSRRGWTMDPWSMFPIPKKNPSLQPFLFFAPKKGISPSRNNLKTHGFRMSLFQPYPSCVRIAKGYTLQGSVCISQSGGWLVGWTGSLSWLGKHKWFFCRENFLGELEEKDFAIEVWVVRST